MYTQRVGLLLLLVFLSLRSFAQQDTTGQQQQDWSAAQIVSDTPHVDAHGDSLMAQFRADSLRKIAEKADSAKAVIDTQKTAAYAKEFIKYQLKPLCAKNTYGRGYVKDGWDTAAKFILKQFKRRHLQPMKEKGPYAQGFAFPVNTFPGRMNVFINGDSMQAGRAYLVDAASSPFVMDSGQELSVTKIDFKKVSDTAGLAAKLAGIDSGGHSAYYLKNLDRACDAMGLRQDQIIAQLPRGLYVVPVDGKLTWTVSREQIPATVLYVKADSLPRKVKRISAKIDAVYVPRQRSENIIAQVPGKVKDTFVVFTAHYDHLGMMGLQTVFPGASDNASGVAMLLYLAAYFAKHPQYYSIMFIAFGGEEASLMGSEFYVWHPFVPIKNIKFLTNIDIMGDATNGITVENAPENPLQFDLLQKINSEEKYLRILYPRPNAANSDHYYFARLKVPSFFIYSNGGHGYYHDIYDVRTALSLNHVDDVARLLIDFTTQLKDVPNAPPPATDSAAMPPVNKLANPAETNEPPAEGTAPPPQKEDEPSQTPDEPSQKPDDTQGDK